MESHEFAPMVYPKALSLLLAGMLAFMTPAWCCCVTDAVAGAPDAAPSTLTRQGAGGGLPACHAVPVHDRNGLPGGPCRGEESSSDGRACDCPAMQLAAGRDASDGALAPSQPSPLLLPSFAAMPAIPFVAVDLPVRLSLPSDTGPPSADGGTLRALHCLLLI